MHETIVCLSDRYTDLLKVLQKGTISIYRCLICPVYVLRTSVVLIK